MPSTWASGYENNKDSLMESQRLTEQYLLGYRAGATLGMKEGRLAAARRHRHLGVADRVDQKNGLKEDVSMRLEQSSAGSSESCPS